MTRPPESVVLVGHCGPDMFMLKSAVQRFVPGATVATANSIEELSMVGTAGVLLLVNRVLDGRFGSDSGIELIRQISQDDGAPRAMLISNFPESQAEAEAAGAEPGFGKSNLFDERTGQLIRGEL